MFLLSKWYTSLENENIVSLSLILHGQFNLLF